MSGALIIMRPAARSAAVRPHSALLLSPRPASTASPWRTSLFFVPLTPALWQQSYWMASPCRVPGRGGVVTVTPLVTPLVTPKSLQSLDIPNPLPRYHQPPAHVIRSRARTCAILSLSLVTWEQEIIVYVEQWLSAFPRPLPPPSMVVTWEQPESAALVSDRLHGGSNKVEAGNGDLQRAAAGARRKFRAPIARLVAAGALELGRIRELATRRGDNGGKLRFATRLDGHVGRLMLEGLRQAPDLASFPAMCRKLGRLRDHPAGELTLLRLARPPGAPNRGRRSAAMLALHARPIWIEDRALGALLRGYYSDRASGDGKNARIGNRRRGPGGICFSKVAEKAERAHACEAGERAGVNTPAAIARPHDAGEETKLRRDFAAVNGAAA